MLIRYADLTSMRMQAGDGSTHAVTDVFVADNDLGATYVVVDTGGWFSGREAMIAIDRFAEPDVSASRWPADIAESELDDRQPPADVPDAGDAGHPEGRRDEPPRALPAALLGPFGSAAVPAMLAGAMPAGADAIPAKADPDSQTAPDVGLRSVGDMLENTTVDAEDGEAGRLMGLVFESRGWHATHLVIETGGDGLPANQRVVPVGLVDRIDWQGRALSLAAPVARVHGSPDLHEMDGLDGKWYNKVMAYYGLQS